MWGNLRAVSKNLLHLPQWAAESKRTAFVLRRVHPVRLSKLGSPYKKKLHRKNYYYELVEDTDSKKKPPVELVLLKDVPGIGMLGDKIEINCYLAYRDLLLPKLATYADSPEAKSIIRTEADVHFSSKYFRIVEKFLSSQALAISLSPETEWTLEPWHVKMALRNMGISVKEECITLPEKPISGPRPETENKDFVVKLTMNKSETVLLRCRIYNNALRGVNAKDKSIIDFNCNPIFPEEKDMIESLIKTEKDIKTSKLMSMKWEPGMK